MPQSLCRQNAERESPVVHVRLGKGLGKGLAKEQIFHWELIEKSERSHTGRPGYFVNQMTTGR